MCGERKKICVLKKKKKKKAGVERRERKNKKNNGTPSFFRALVFEVSSSCLKCARHKIAGGEEKKVVHFGVAAQNIFSLSVCFFLSLYSRGETNGVSFGAC